MIKIEIKEIAKGLQLGIAKAIADGLSVSSIKAMEYSKGWVLVMVTTFEGDDFYYGVDIKNKIASQH